MDLYYVSDNITSSWPQDIGNIHVTIWSQTILQQVGLKIMEIYDSSIAPKTVPYPLRITACI